MGWTAPASRPGHLGAGALRQPARRISVLLRPLVGGDAERACFESAVAGSADAQQAADWRRLATGALNYRVNAHVAPTVALFSVALF